MKTRTVALGVLAIAVILAVGYQYGVAQPVVSRPPARIGIVSVRKVFRDCQLNVKYRSSALAEQSRLKDEEGKLDAEIKAEEAGLKVLKPGSTDHLTKAKELFNKKASLEAMRQYNAQARALKDQRWTEALYQELLVIVKELAKQKQLDLVLEGDDVEFPLTSGDELMMALQTHKVLYSGGCVDLNAEAMAELDKRESKFKF
jgi:Skp family chaperone for outer membrane proteins